MSLIRVRQGLAQVRRRLEGLYRGPAVLLYHRLGAGSPDPFRLSVSAAHFQEHLTVLRKLAAIVPLEELATRPSNRRSVVAITFDDGYADNLHAACPLLEKADASATVFVTTGSPGAEFWWDTLARVTQSADRLPDPIELKWPGGRQQLSLEKFRFRRSPLLRRRIVQDEAGARLSLLRGMHPILRNLEPGHRSDMLDQLTTWARIKRSDAHGSRALTVEELQRLAGSPLITIGAHTVTHPMLASVDAEREETEIRFSRSTLEGLLGRDIRGFAYPFGGRLEYSARSVRAVREAGFSYACTSESGTVRRADSAFEIPRRWVDDWNGDEFERRLRRWLGLR